MHLLSCAAYRPASTGPQYPVARVNAATLRSYLAIFFQHRRHIPEGYRV